MHDIEPYFLWRELYHPEDDERSPTYGQFNDSFAYTKQVYNYYIHPEWDEMGSQTLYLKILYADYEEGLAIIELIGEWNDCIHNDIMYLKRDIADLLIQEGISKFILLCDHVLNYHGSDDCYYEEWKEDLSDADGYVILVNLLPHVLDEMSSFGLKPYVHFGKAFQDINWRKMNPTALAEFLESKL